ncbi:MAG: rhomboid family intramembrane serine protease [Paludibacter sp.]|nr:rhomboid family intramembrane serine protease [Paludibacter sp.]
MPFNSNPSYQKRHFYYAIFIPFAIGILMILSFIVEKGMNWDFHTAGIFPRRFESLPGIFSIIFVHADWSHIVNNIISFVILGSLLYYFYNEIANRILLISYVLSGIILWTIGRENWHIGASGLVYSLAFFLFFSGIIRKHVPLIAISLAVSFVYGSMVWHIFPWQTHDPISWEGHLSGGIVGLLLSIWYKNSGPQKPIVIWDEEEEIDINSYNEEELSEI